MDDARQRTRAQLLERIEELEERIALLESTRPEEDSRAAYLEDDLRLARALTEAAVDALDLRELARILASHIQRVFDSHSVSLYVISPEGNELVMQNVGLAPGIMSAAERILGRRIPLVHIPRSDDSVFWKTVSSGTTTVMRSREEVTSVLREFATLARRELTDPPDDSETLVDRIITLLALECTVHLPLMARGRPLGMLSISSRRQFREDEIVRIESIARQVAAILAAAQSEMDWQRERNRADAYMTVAAGPLVHVAPDATVLSMNPAGCELLGLPESEIIGRDFIKDFIPEHMQDAGRSALATAVAGDMASAFEIPVRTVRGEERLVRWRATALRESDGSVGGFLASGVDLTRLRESEEREARGRRRFRALIENATDVILLVDEEAFITYASPSIRTVLGYEPGEVVGANCFEFTHPDDTTPLSEEFRMHNERGGLTPSYEMRVRHKDRSWRMLEGKANHQLENPDIRGIILTARDVTDRVRVEDSMERSATRFRLLIEHSRELMFVLGPNLRIRYVSPSCTRALGYTERALAGMGFEDLAHPADISPDVFRRSARAGGTRDARLRLRTMDRRWMHYDITVTDLNEDPAVKGFVVNATRCSRDEDGSAEQENGSTASNHDSSS